MANYQQTQPSFNQYFSGYGTGNQFDNSSSQNKWGTTSNTGNQTQASQSQTQQQIYQAAAQNYAAASGFYGNQAYGQQTQQSYTSSVDSNMSGIRNTGTGNTASTFTGNKATSSYNSATTTTGSTNMNQTSNIGTSNLNYSTGFSSGVSYSNNTAENKSGMNATNQMFGAGYGNTNQNTGMNTNMVSNMAVPATSQTQSFGSSVTADTLSQFNQMSQMSQNQMFGGGTNYGVYTSGDSTGGNFPTGYNQQAFNTGMMSLLQQTLMQQANGGAAFGNGMVNTWGMSDADGGFYAPPVDNTYQSAVDMGNSGNKQMKKGKKWSGKEKQDFYGNRFAQMFTGMPGVLGQPQTGGGKGKRLMNGVRFNIKGEKVIDVEIPLSLYSRWGQLRKFFSKQDTEVAKHLIEFHDENCEECLEREQRKKKKTDLVTEHVEVRTAAVEEEEIEETEEDMMIRQVMGFGKFNTTREAMSKDNQSDATAGACVSDTGAKSTSTSWETVAGFVGPVKPADQPLKSETEPEKKAEPVLTEEERNIMSKLGWSVFNKKKNESGEEDDDDDDDDDNDDEGKMDIGGKDGTAA